jgi:hypothetical protein
MNTENKKEPFPLFPLTTREKWLLSEAAKHYIAHPTSTRGICNLIITLGWSSSLASDLCIKLMDSLEGKRYFTHYLENINRYDLAATPAKSRLHWLRLLINQPTIEETEEKQNANKE